MSAAPPRACDFCGSEAEKLLRCTRCRQAAYCGPACQRSAWGSHKASCAAAAAAKDGEARSGAGEAAASGSRVAAQETRPEPGTAAAPTAAPPKGPSDGAAAARPWRLVGVLSSHIGDRRRLQRLASCLRSVERQTRRLEGFFVVWSAPEDIAAGVEELLGATRRALAPSPLQALRQTKKTSQFYDIRWLYEELLSKEPPETWLLFTDDDDIWGPERARSYATVVSQHAPTPGVTAVCATHKVRPTHRGKVADSAEEVASHLASGDARHCGGVHVEEEFFDFACPRDHLGAFLGICNEETLLHPFCDLRFTRFMCEYYKGGKVMYFPTDHKDRWVYYYATAYRTPEDSEAFEQFEAQGQASTVVKERPEDRQEALEACRQCNGGPDPSDEELASMLEFVSGLRQNIDGMLIRHFPEDPLSTAELKRVAVGQCQGQLFAVRLAERLARQSCKRFGLRLV